MAGADGFIFEMPIWPLEEPVLVFTLALFVFLVGPLTIKRLGQPGIVGIVLLGAILGPGGLHFVDHGEAIILLGNVGLIYLLFTLALDIDIRGFTDEPQSAALFGLVSFGLPFIVGTLVGYLVLDLSLFAASLLAAVFASHTLLAYPVIDQYGVTDNDAVNAVFAGILFTDTLALIVLALVVGGFVEGFSLLLLVEVGASLLILFAGVWFVVPPIARHFFQNFSQESYFEFLFVMMVFFAAASLAELLDIAPILGAFVAGLALNRLIPEGGTLKTRIEFVGNALFIPFFLLHVGMLVDFGVILDGIRTLELAAVIILTMFVTKWIAAQGVGHIQGYDTNERGVIFGLSTGQAAAALAVTLIGFDVGLFDEPILNAVVILLLVTAVISPWLTGRAAYRLALDQEVDVDSEPFDPRILLPLSHAAELQRRLLELAFTLKDVDSESPVHVLTVVRPDAQADTEKAVASSQENLSELREVGNEADVAIDIETRVNHNPASGIVRGALEERADLLMMGWEGTQSLKDRMFGSVIDQVLKRTRLPVLVARLGHPINTTERMFVVVPHGVDHHEGFYEGVYFLKKIADRVDADLEVLLVGGDENQFERHFELVEPEVTMQFHAVAAWREVLPFLREHATEDDVTAVLSTRPNRIGWDDQLHHVPKRLIDLPPKSFIVFTLRDGDPDYDRQFLRFK